MIISKTALVPSGRIVDLGVQIPVSFSKPISVVMRLGPLTTPQICFLKLHLFAPVVAKLAIKSKPTRALARRGVGQGLRDVAQPKQADVVSVRRGDEDVAVGLANFADRGEEDALRVVKTPDDVTVLVQLQHQPVPRELPQHHLRWGALREVTERKGREVQRESTVAHRTHT